MINILAIIFVFSILIIIHELGHFLAARWMGVRVERFSIGFPPTIFRKKIGQTDFQVGAIPLGGYVKMAGMLDESMDAEMTGAEDEFNSKPVWRRIVIITAGVVMNLFLAILILTLLNFFQGERIRPYTTIGVVADSGVGAKIGFKPGDRIIAVNGQEVNTWEDIESLYIDGLNSDIHFLVERDGKRMDLLYKKEWFSQKQGEMLDIAPLIPGKVGDLVPDMPAAQIGLQKGDQIIRIGEVKINSWQELTREIQAYPGKPVQLKWLRGKDTLSATITPQAVPETGPNGETKEVGRIGIYYYFEHRDIGLFNSLVLGVKNTFQLIHLNIRGLWWVISGAKSATEVIGGPIMIAKMAGDAARTGWVSLWYLIAALSSILAFFNILPIPALDGGHLFFLLIEGAMGRPLSMKARIKIQQIGMAILLTFIILILYVDISRLLF